MTSTLPSSTVFVVDDDDAVRSSLSWLFESVGLNVLSFDSAQAFLDGFDPSVPGCLVLDIRMPGMSGLELQQRLDQSLPIIVITGHGDVPMAVRAMKAGAFDFVEKPFNAQLLLETVQKALAEDRNKRVELRRQKDCRERIKRLTPRETEVAQLVFSGAANREIAEQLGLSAKTVEVHRARVMNKLEAGSVAELVRIMIGAGLQPAERESHA